VSNRIMRVFLDADLRCSHLGLSLLAAKEKVKVTELSDGEHIVFINRKVNKMKIYSARNIVSCHLSTGKMDLGTLNYFSEAFGAQGFKYDNALKKVLTERLKAL
jgi:hypothetical protein